jgi:hypothetical protein
MTRISRALAGARCLRLRQRDAGHAHPVVLRRVDGEAAPAAADVEQPLALFEGELRADELELRPLRLLQRLGAARPDRARVGHRLVEEQREEVVRDVVVVRDGALVARDRVAPALRAQFHGGRLGQLLQCPGAHGGGGEPALGAGVDRGRAVAVEQRQHLVDVVDVELAGDVRAAETELAGRAQHVAERGRRADGEHRAVAGGRRQLAPVPERDAERALGQDLGQRLAQRRRAHAASASFVAWRSRGIRTTSQARPSFSSAAIT